MHVCVVTTCAHVLWPRPDIYCNYYVREKFKPGVAPGCYDARGNTAYERGVAGPNEIQNGGQIQKDYKLLALQARV